MAAGLAPVPQVGARQYLTPFVVLEPITMIMVIFFAIQKLFFAEQGTHI